MKKTKRLLSLVIMLTMIIFNGSFLFVFAEGEEAPAAEPAPAAAAAEKTETPATNASDANPAVPSEEKVSGDSKNAAENDAQLSNTNEGNGVASKGGASTTDISSDAPVNDAGTKAADTDMKAAADNLAKAADSDTPKTYPDTPITLTITATKTWEGSGTTPTKVSITLNQYAEGSTEAKNTYTEQATADSNWKATFTINDYEKGDTFEVVEETVTGYETTVTQQPSVTLTEPTGLTKYTPGSDLEISAVNGKSIIVLKKGNQWAVWTPYHLTEVEMDLIHDTLVNLKYKVEDVDAYDTSEGLEFYHGDLHANFGFIVNINNDDTAKLLTLDAHESWSWIVIGVYKGINVVDAAIKNTPTTIDISGTKKWDDDSNRDGKRPDSITVNLLADGDQVASKTVKGEGDSWSFSFEDVPEYSYTDEGAKKIEYTVTEGDVADYTPSISGYTITNIHTPETIEIAGTKTWDDASNQDNKRPESITVKLLADGEEIDSKKVTGEGDSWDYSFGDLPKYKKGEVGQEIEYTVEEDPVDGYETTVDGLNITNKHTPETVNVAVKKVWDDNKNADGKRPASLNVTLSNGNSYSLTEAEGWTLSIDGLPKYKDGKEIEYSWTEETVDGYKLSQIVEDKSEDTITTTLTNTVQTEVVPDEPTDDNDQTPDKTTGQTSDKPKTGDNGYAAEMLVFLVSLTALAVALYTRRWREDE